MWNDRKHRKRQLLGLVAYHGAVRWGSQARFAERDLILGQAGMGVTDRGQRSEIQPAGDPAGSQVSASNFTPSNSIY